MIVAAVAFSLPVTPNLADVGRRLAGQMRRVALGRIPSYGRKR
jgi:hypothetical protein